MLRENEVLVEDGELFNNLYIPISTSILLMSSNGSETPSCIGSVKRGRSTNLFNFLRSLPAAYAFVAAEDGEILVLPREFLDRLFSMAPEVKKYLLNVTKDPNYRNLMKEFRNIGVSQQFVTLSKYFFTSGAILKSRSRNSLGRTKISPSSAATNA